jgi:hypothetical protein
MNVNHFLETHPQRPSQLGAVTSCVKACYGCSEACTLCADACLAEEAIAQLRRCIRMCLDCAAICEVTGRVVARQTETDTNLLRRQLESCATACNICAQECEQHSGMHEHCRLCAQSCRACEKACQELLAVL